MRGGRRNAQHLFHSDVLLSTLHKSIPTYTAFPNLAWQAVEHSDLTGRTYSNYAPDGQQRSFRHILSSLAESGSFDSLSLDTHPATQ